jgi:hypothetical protein
MGKYDIIFGNGCSFVQGSEVNNLDLPSHPVESNPGRFTDVLAKYFNAEEVNIAAGGAGNDKIFRTTFDWVENNLETLKSKRILYCLGLTFPQRKEVYVNSVGDFVKFNIYKNDSIAERISKQGIGISEEQMQEFHTVYLSEFYNDDQRIMEHYRLFTSLLAYISSSIPNCDFFIFNSLFNEFPDWFREKLNLDKKFTPAWNRVLEVAQNKTGIKYIQPGGHPNKQAHKEMAKYIIERYG